MKALLLHTPGMTFDALLRESGVSHYLERLRSHHLDTYDHSLRVGLLALDIGMELALDAPRLLLLGRAGLLHDIGKLHISREVLHKLGLLEPEEWQLMREHSRAAFEELNGQVDESVRRLVVAHHEYAHQSYPRQRNGRAHTGPERRTPNPDLEQLAQVVAITDMFDALMQRRSYKEPLSHGETERTLREQFTGDPALIPRVLARYAW